MQLVLENTTKGVINLPGLKLEPGENDLTPEQLAAWRALRTSGTSRDLLRKRQPRWPARIVEMMSNGWIMVRKASGADERDARRKVAKGRAKPTRSAPGSSKSRGTSSSGGSSGSGE